MRQVLVTPAQNAAQTLCFDAVTDTHLTCLHILTDVAVTQGQVKQATTVTQQEEDKQDSTNNSNNEISGSASSRPASEMSLCRSDELINVIGYRFAVR
jgi:hypothetical protein